MLGTRADRKHRRLERKVLRSAQAVSVVSQDMKRQFEEMGSRKIRVIPNGFDPDDFDTPFGEESSGSKLDPKFSLTHIGTIVASRNPISLWRVLSELVAENKDLANDLVVRLVGAADYAVNRSLEETNLRSWVEKVEYLPHQQAIGMLKKSQVLLLLINDTPNAKGILTGKFFEYMNAGRPILAIGPKGGEADQILKETGTGQLIDFQDMNKLKSLILDFYHKYQQGRLDVQTQNIHKYSRKSLTGRITELFTELLKTK
jgi:glycosyltransferase involved in cell wall biosynthesis